MALAYRREIDGLRALAVLPIVLFHAGFEYFSGGYVGVDVFFVISGFLITSIIVVQHSEGRFRFRDFYERRARRILPALFFILLVCLPMAWVWMLPGEVVEFAQSLRAVLGFASNFFFWGDSGYFSTSSEYRPLLHTWSLAVEEQFYLLFPMLLIALLRCRGRFVVAAIVILGVASLLLAEYTSRAAPLFAFYMLPTRVWEFAIGSLAAFAEQSGKGALRFDRRLREVLGAVGLLLILWSIFRFTKSLPYPSVWTVLPTLGTMLIILFARQGTLVGRLLGLSPLVLMGLISYSAYLWHQPVFAFARLRQLDPLSTGQSTALVVASFVLAYLSWKFVEPIWRGARSRSLRSFLICGAAAVALLLAFSTMALRTWGFPGRLTSLPPDYIARSWIDLKMTGNQGQLCYTPHMMPCLIASAPAGSPRVLLLGDSHAGDLGSEFERYLTRNQFHGVMYSIPGCAYLASQASVNGGDCGRGRTLILDAAKEKAFDTYLIVGNFIVDTESVPVAVRDRDIASFVDFTRQLLASGARVVLFTPRMSLNYDPKKAAALGQRNRVRPVQEDSQNVAAWHVAWKDLSRDANFAQIDQVEALVEAGCGNRGCFDGHAADGHLLYRDLTHLTDLGAKVVFNAFAHER